MSNFFPARDLQQAERENESLRQDNLRLRKQLFTLQQQQNSNSSTSDTSTSSNGAATNGRVRDMINEREFENLIKYMVLKNDENEINKARLLYCESLLLFFFEYFKFLNTFALILKNKEITISSFVLHTSFNKMPELINKKFEMFFKNLKNTLDHQRALINLSPCENDLLDDMRPPEFVDQMFDNEIFNQHFKFVNKQAEFVYKQTLEDFSLGNFHFLNFLREYNDHETLRQDFDQFCRVHDLDINLHVILMMQNLTQPVWTFLTTILTRIPHLTSVVYDNSNGPRDKIVQLNDLCSFFTRVLDEKANLVVDVYKTHVDFKNNKIFDRALDTHVAQHQKRAGTYNDLIPPTTLAHESFLFDVLKNTSLYKNNLNLNFVSSGDKRLVYYWESLFNEFLAKTETKTINSSLSVPSAVVDLMTEFINFEKTQFTNGSALVCNNINLTITDGGYINALRNTVFQQNLIWKFLFKHFFFSLLLKNKIKLDSNFVIAVKLLIEKIN